MPVESNRNATFKMHFNILHSMPGFPHDTLFAPTIFPATFYAVMQVDDDDDDDSNNCKIGFHFGTFA